jgi:hypothetical protein
MSEQYERSREAAKITLNKVSSWEELNAATLEEADKKFKEATKKYWREFAVSGVLQFDPKEGKQVLRPFTDLDGRAALGVIKEAGIDTSKLTYVRPGEYLQGAINLDTGDKFGVVYEEPTYTAYFDHHAPGTKEVTSTAEIVYKTMVDLGMLEKSEAMDRLIKFVTDIDNRRFPPKEFLRSGKTILGLQRALDFEKLLAYFKDHKSPTEELTPEEFEKYGLREEAEKQQKIVDESMATLERMAQEGKVIDTAYGKVVINENNELKVGSSAAYVKYDGIINFTPGKSFAATFKDKDINDELVRRRLGDKFQGEFIRGKMWIYNEEKPLQLTLEEIVDALKERGNVHIKIICQNGVLYIDDSTDVIETKSYVHPGDDWIGDPRRRGFYMSNYVSPAQEAAREEKEEKKFFANVSYDSAYSIAKIPETIKEVGIGEIQEIYFHPFIPQWLREVVNDALNGKQSWELQEKMGELPTEFKKIERIKSEEVLVRKYDRWGRKLDLYSYRLNDPRVMGKKEGEKIKEE